jgi:peptide-methionine (S)-S-oxide reductase
MHSRAHLHGPLSGRSGLRGVACAALITMVLAASLTSLQPAAGAEPAVTIPAADLDNPKAEGAAQTAVLAGGCFWGVQGVFEHVKGVRQVVSGYAGGKQNTADYETVSSGTTGHAESVRITFDPKQVTYGEILRIYFSVAHDPTQLNRQDPDSGTQYRSSIFYGDDSQRKIALAYIAQLDQAHAFGRKIVTRVDPLTGFYPAESYHQDYLFHNPGDSYIVINDLPKIAHLQQLFPQMYVGRPVLVAATH